MLQKDTEFVLRMHAENSDFIVPSWYWKPIDMSFEEFEKRRTALMHSRGCQYQGMGVLANGSSYSFTVPLDASSDETTIIFKKKDARPRVLMLPVGDENRLFAELEAFVKERTMDEP